LVDPEDHGFTLVLQGLQNGMHPGQADNPIAVQRWAEDNYLVVLWTVQSGQFDDRFDGYFAWKCCPDCEGNGGDYHDNVWKNCERCDDGSELVPLSDQEKDVITGALVSETKDYYGHTVTYLKPDYRESPDLATRMEAALKSLSKPYARIASDGSTREYDTIQEYMEDTND